MGTILEANNYDAKLQVKLFKKDLERYKVLAKKHGMNVSTFARFALSNYESKLAKKEQN